MKTIAYRSKLRIMQNMIIELPPKENGIKKAYPKKPINEIITNGIFLVDEKWTVKYWNNGAEKLLGIKANEIIGENVWEKFKADLPQDFYAVYHHAAFGNIPGYFKKYWDRMAAWFNVNTYYFNNTLCFSFTSSSHPEHSEYSEPQLKILKELYQFVTEVTNDCLWEWDVHTKEIFWIDGGHKRVFGYQIENTVIPQSFWEDNIHPDDRERILSRLNKIIAANSGFKWEDEYRFKKANGDYAYVHDRGHIFYDGDDAVSMIGATQDISARKLSENELQEERLLKQKEITDAVLTAHENERADIGKELHDNLNQILGATKLYIEMAKKNGDNRAMCLEKSSGYIVEVIDEIRKISKALASPVLDIKGLIGHIKILIDDLMIIQPIEIEFIEEGINEDHLTKKLQLNIFRIIQEQLNNILKHAKATHAIVSLIEHENEIILNISDNGRGCNTSESTKGIGIRNITSRAELYNGKVTITSKPAEGFELKVVLPYEKHTEAVTY